MKRSPSCPISIAASRAVPVPSVVHGLIALSVKLSKNMPVLPDPIKIRLDVTPIRPAVVPSLENLVISPSLVNLLKSLTFPLLRV